LSFVQNTERLVRPEFMWKYDIAFTSMRGGRGKTGENKKKQCKDTLRFMDARFIKRTRTKNVMHMKFYHSNKEKCAAKMSKI
jgi:hypothetical protein